MVPYSPVFAVKRIHVICGRCDNSLGHYNVEQFDDNGTVVGIGQVDARVPVTEPQERRDEWRMFEEKRLLTRRTLTARNARTVERFTPPAVGPTGATTCRWRCRCGADYPRRLDKLAPAITGNTLYL